MWIWREDELSLKEFYKLTFSKRKEYINFIESLSINEQSSCDQYLISMYGNKKKITNFISIEE